MNGWGQNQSPTIKYPFECKVKVDTVFGENRVQIVLNSPVTVFIGANGLGKTQTLKVLRNYLRGFIGEEKVRYLSSNRIGDMEVFRSKTNQHFYSPDDYSFGGKEIKAHRCVLETAAGDFFTLDEKKDVFIKVAERLSVLFKRQIYLRWDAGCLKVFFETTETQGEYSVVAEASGLINIISILSALYDDAVKVLLIDEPEVSLHPQLQAYLLREIKSASENNGKTIILSTHSSGMIPFDSVKDLCNLVFFSEGRLPIQIRPDMDELNNRKLREFVMRMSQIYKDGLFAKKILLIEGVSDQIICRFLLQKLNLNADVAGTQIIPVEGKNQYPAITKLFRLTGKQIVILTDLDAFTDDNSVIDLFVSLPLAREIANRHGLASLSETVHNIKTTIGNLIERSSSPEFEAKYKDHPYWKNKKEDTDSRMSVRRAVIAMLFKSSEEDLQTWPEHQEWKALKERLESLFNDLETLGCFILRRGTIESYYCFSRNDTDDKKPSEAISEVSHLADQSINFIEEHYSDIIRSLKYVSVVEEIDEGYAVKKELLSELALLMEVLPRASDEKELYSVIKRTKGTPESLFLYSIIEEDGVKGLLVDVSSKILNVSGFPFRIFPGENVNDVVSKKIMQQ